MKSVFQPRCAIRPLRSCENCPLGIITDPVSQRLGITSKEHGRVINALMSERRKRRLWGKLQLRRWQQVLRKNVARNGLSLDECAKE